MGAPPQLPSATPPSTGAAPVTRTALQPPSGGQIGYGEEGYDGPPPAAPAASATPKVPDANQPGGTGAQAPGPSSAIPTSTPYTPVSYSGSNPPVYGTPFGDSIAAGYITQAGLPGTVGHDPSAVDATAAWSRNPQQVLSRLQKVPDNSLDPNLVYPLSSGVSNDPSGIGLVPQQIAELKRAGAKKIQLVGVGNTPGFEGTGKDRKYHNLVPYNPVLKKYADEAGISWGGELPAVVHPDKGYYRRSLTGSGNTGYTGQSGQGI
jgi:hypothetical protein